MTDEPDLRDRDEVITSPANPTIKFARSLHRRRVRYRERAILVEGSRAITAALDLDVRLRSLLIDIDRSDDVDAALLARVRASSTRVLFVEPSLFRLISDTEHPQPLIAICDLPEPLIPSNSTFVVTLDGVRDPGNLGTLIRSAAAAGSDGVALLHGNVDPYNPKSVRASAGAIFAVPVQMFRNLNAIIAQCFATPPIVVLADSNGETAYDTADMTQSLILVIGGEATGATEEVRTYADIVVQIPMSSGTESLNAAVAGAVIAFEVARQRRK